MHTLKTITSEGIPRALEKIDRYRLLNEPARQRAFAATFWPLNPTIKRR
jgi:hypothetical protein